MAGRWHEIKATVNAIVDDVSPIETTLVVEVALELLVDIFDDRFVAATGTANVKRKTVLQDHKNNNRIKQV